MPRCPPHLVKSAIRLLRQSTTVPKTSNTSAFTAEISDMVRSVSFAVAFEFAGFAHISEPRARSELFPVLDEARPFGDLIVQFLRRLIRFVRHPVESACSGLASGGFDGANQGTSRSASSHRRLHEQIFEVAVAQGSPSRAMQQVVSYPNQLSIALGDERAETLERIEESPPRCICYLRCERRLV